MANETQTFSASTIRSNSSIVVADWWNVLRKAGLRLEQIFGLGVYPQTQQSITDGMSATNLTSALFSSASYTGFKLHAKYFRDDGTNQRSGFINVYGWYNTKKTAWEVSQDEVGESCTASTCTSVASGITFSISAAGQVKVATDTMGGSHVGKLNWKCVDTFTVES